MPYALSQENLPQPLSEVEKRQIYEHLLNYKKLLKEYAQYKEEVKKLIENGDKERLELQRSIMLEKVNAALKDKDLTLTKEQLDFYTNAYKVCSAAMNKKRSVWCWVKKILFIGIPRC